jgi:hypothetical protein
MDEELKAKKAGVERKRYRDFQVYVGGAGFSVNIGCQQFYFSTARELSRAIVAYLKDPQGTEVEYQQNNHEMVGVLAPPTGRDMAMNEGRASRPIPAGTSNQMTEGRG